MFKCFLLLVLLGLCSSAFAQLTNESELASVKTGGNSEVLTTNAKTTNLYKWVKNQLKFGGHYTYGEAKDGVSARNWDVNLRGERELSEHFSLVTGEIIEGNRFTSVKARYNSDFGLRYYSIKTDLKVLVSELSLRYTIEDRYAPAPDQYATKVRIYNEFSHKISETVQYKLWLEVIPNFTYTKDYLINGEASLTSILNSVFSLKVAYLGMYDNQVAIAGYKNYDYQTTTSLVAKF
jgi:putative salt-induced outer membrane protein YdiY